MKTSRFLAIFFRRLSYLLKNNLPLHSALETLKKDMQLNAPFAKVIGELKLKVEEGKSFSLACANFPTYFSSFSLKIITLGEKVGKLDDVLLKYASFLEKRAIFHKKLLSLLIYPFLVVIVFLGSILFFINIVFPQIELLFEDMGGDLPYLTLLVMKVLSFFNGYGFMILLFILILSILLLKYGYLPTRKIVIDKLILKIPIVKELVLKGDLLNFCSALCLSIQSGCRFLEGFSLAKNLVKNSYLAALLNEVEDKAQAGKPIKSLLKETHLLPFFFSSLLGSALKDGEVEDSLNHLIETYEKELELELDMIIKFIEPLLIIILGMAVGIIVISVLLPILDLSKQVA
ncbi:type II secretion system F family protein [Candidatus Auribacterota bacterium]